MEWMGVNELRERYLSFFESKGHVRLKSAPLVPQEDASLLLVNSGMAPLKKYFLGLESLPGNRATSCQKCIRTPDIERVGKTSRHGTFFEMLGNFSFGDYFKEEATDWAWEFLTQALGIPAERLWVSVFEEDEEAVKIWTEHRGIDPGRIVRLGREDNYWEIGAGPCGPCSEIYVDRGEKYACGDPNCAVGCDCDRYVEIWNLVFTQFNSDGNGRYSPLEKKNIDTGMGLERLACVMQGVDNLFEVDTVQKIMKRISDFAGVSYKQDEKSDISLRVITDHIRSTVFMVGDGVVPQNEGRGYVLRRLLRRAARHGRLLGVEKPFLYDACETVISENAGAYPELAENKDYIVKVIQVEEERFSRTIEQGMDLFLEIAARAESAAPEGARQISGEDAFRLYDTFGFPVDLTREIAADRGIDIDEAAFQALMQEQRARARKAREAQGDVGWEEDVLASKNLHDKFVGYSALSASTKVLAVIRDGALADEALVGDQAVLVLETTPFYAESGGQTGDTGLVSAGAAVFRVRDCRKSPTGHFLHIGEVTSGRIAPGDAAVAAVDKTRRQAAARNHSATHLLHAALREVLGAHVHQAGSMVDDAVCRFDFTHFSAVTPEQLAQTEAKVNRWILEALPVQIEETSMERAKEMGAMALFGDKYGDVVRVCKMGEGESVELCGGTHVENTAHIGLFKLLRESSVAAGVRRVEGTTGEGVLRFIAAQEALIQSACEAVRCTGPAELVAKAQAGTVQLKELQKQVEELSGKLASGQMDSLTDNMPQIGPVRFVSATLGEAGPDALKQTADRLRDKFPDIVGVLAALDGDKAALLAFAGKEAVKAGVHCGKLVKQVSAIAGGGGGGRPDSAMGGASDLSKVDEALRAAKDMVETMLK